MESKKRLPLIALENVCIPKGKGGLGLQRISTMNELLLAKLLWRWHREDGEGRNIWDNKYNRDHTDFLHFLSSKDAQGGSQIWNNSLNSKHILRRGIKWKVGIGRKFLFWEDI